MISQCENCEFYLTKNDKFCLNCGLPSTGKTAAEISPDKESASMISLTAYISLFFAAGYIAYKFVNRDNDFSSLFPFLVLAAVLSLIISIVIVSFSAYRINKKSSRKKLEYSENPQTLIYRESILNQKQFDFETRYRETERLEQENKSNNPETLFKLKEARDSVSANLAFCEIQAQRIRVIRLQNSLLPVLYMPKEFSTDEILDLLNENLDKLKNIKLSLTNDYALDFPGKSADERDVFISQLDENLEIVSNIREKIIARRSGILSGKTDSFPDSFAYESRDLLHQIESFNIQAKLSDSENFLIEDIYADASADRLNRL